MSNPSQFPWCSRLAATLDDAGKAARACGMTAKAGQAEYRASHDMRSRRARTRTERVQSRKYRTDPSSNRLRKRLDAWRTDRLEIATGCQWIRSITDKTPIKEWNGHGMKITGYVVSYRQWLAAKRNYEAKPKRSTPTHLEVHTCPSCDGRGLGKWIENRRTGDMYQARCAKCSGSGRVLRKVRGAGADEPIEWDGTLTSAWEATGVISPEQADTIREKCRQRHEETDYEELLSRGYSKEDARSEMIGIR